MVVLAEQDFVIHMSFSDLRLGLSSGALALWRRRGCLQVRVIDVMHEQVTT
jgi:hypothetical protein